MRQITYSLNIQCTGYGANHVSIISTATPSLPPQSSPGLPPPHSPSSSTSLPATPDTPSTMRFSYSKLLFPDEEEYEAHPIDAPGLVSASHPNEDTASESPSPTSPEVPCVFPKCPPRRQGSAKQKGRSSKSSLPVIPEVLSQQRRRNVLQPGGAEIILLINFYRYNKG